jgi:hypothetical protein
VVPSSDSSFPRRWARGHGGVPCAAPAPDVRMGSDGRVLRSVWAARRQRIRIKPAAASSRARSWRNTFNKKCDSDSLSSRGWVKQVPAWPDPSHRSCGASGSGYLERNQVTDVSG